MWIKDLEPYEKIIYFKLKPQKKKKDKSFQEEKRGIRGIKVKENK